MPLVALPTVQKRILKFETPGLYGLVSRGTVWPHETYMYGLTVSVSVTVKGSIIFSHIYILRTLYLSIRQPRPHTENDHSFPVFIDNHVHMDYYFY